MSKRDRRRRYKSAGRVDVKPASMDEIEDIFFPDLIPLDEVFITHLVNEHGFARDEVELFARMGFKYNPKRNSFMMDPEIGYMGFLGKGGETDD